MGVGPGQWTLGNTSSETVVHSPIALCARIAPRSHPLAPSGSKSATKASVLHSRTRGGITLRARDCSASSYAVVAMVSAEVRDEVEVEDGDRLSDIK